MKRFDDSLGLLKVNLIAAYSMDGEANGSLVASRFPAPPNAAFTSTKRFALDQSRQCADFSEPGTMLSVYGVELWPRWTLAVWAKLPFAGEGAILWRGNGRTHLGIQDGKFKSFNTITNESKTFADYDKSWTGWHHIALTSDSTTNTLYIDAVPVGSVPAAPVSERLVLTHVGGQPPDATPQSDATSSVLNLASHSQCGLLDDMFIFDANLKADDLQLIASVPLPPKQPRVDIPVPSNAPSSARAHTNGSALAADLVKTFSDSLVFVSSAQGSGSGFIADFGGKPFMVTNAHVAAGVRGAGFRTLQGTTINIGPASVAVDHDIFVMQAKPVENLMSVMRQVGENAAIGDEIVVLGNAEGGGVINTIMGSIVGIGPTLIEVDAPFQPGNSGSPIIHLKSKKVIGVATYLTIRKYDAATKESIKEPVIRRFGYRIDSVKTWQPVDWNAFYAQASEFENIEKLTADFVLLIKDIADDARVQKGQHTNPVIRNRIDSWLSSKSKRLSAKDSIAQDQNFLSFLKIACQTDVTAAQQRLTYDYFLRQLGEQQRERTEIARVFNRIIETVR